jgi:hypothetical protein
MAPTEVEVKVATKKEAVDEVETKVEVLGKREAYEVATKEVEEEERKQKEDTLNNYASPMDTNIPEMLVGIPLTSGHLPVGEFRLELHTPYKPNKVSNLKRFRFDKTTSVIVQKHSRNLPVTRGNPLSVVTEILVIKDVNRYPLSIESFSIDFVAPFRTITVFP